LKRGQRRKERSRYYATGFCEDERPCSVYAYAFDGFIGSVRNRVMVR